MIDRSTTLLASYLDEAASCFGETERRYLASRLAEAAQRLRALDAENKRLNETLDSNRLSVRVAEGPSNGSMKRVRLETVVSVPLRYWADTVIDTYQMRYMREELLRIFVRDSVKPITDALKSQIVEAALPQFIQLRDQWVREAEGSNA